MSRIKKAIDKGDVENLSSLLEKDASLASKHIRWGRLFNRCSTEPLHYLSDGPFNQIWDHGRQAEMARILIKAGAPVDGAPDSGETPLHGAASLGEADVAQVLIENGADIEASASYPGIPDGTPLDFAVHFGMTNVIDVLVRNGARILSTRMAAGAGQSEKTKTGIRDLAPNSLALLDIFRCAVICDRVEIVDIILEKTNVNTEIDGATALHWASWEAKPRMVQFLLSKGGDPTTRDKKHDMTPMEWAKHRMNEVGARWGHKAVIDTLEGAN